MRPCRGGGGVHVVHLNFKTSRVGVYRCLLLIVGFAITVTIWPRVVVSCREFHFTHCHYFLGQVAYQNLPWQGLLFHSGRTGDFSPTLPMPFSVNFLPCASVFVVFFNSCANKTHALGRLQWQKNNIPHNHMNLSFTRWITLTIA